MSTRPTGISVLAIAVMGPAAWILFLGGRFLTRAVNAYLEIAGSEDDSADFLIVKVVMAAGGGLVSAAFGFALLAVGRGLWSLRFWAYRMTQGLAILSASFAGIVGALSIYGADWTVASVQLPAAGFAGWAIWYLNSKPVAELFSAPAAVPEPTPATPPPPQPSNPEEP